MKLTIEPQSYHFLAMRDELKVQSIIVTPETSENPYGHLVVLSVGPDCKITKPNDRVCVMPENCIGLQHPDHGTVFIVPDSAVFAKYLVEEDAKTE